MYKGTDHQYAKKHRASHVSSENGGLFVFNATFTIFQLYHGGQFYKTDLIIMSNIGNSYYLRMNVSVSQLYISITIFWN